ncbi:MAG TPA: ABC transporter permease [Vicinamibacterales bacterium]|jgi:ABC-type transport system involved in multi-copper enzyme maturation permease subunit
MKPPPLASSALRVFDLSLGEMLWSRRSVFLGVLLGGPVIMALGLRLVWTMRADLMRVNGAPIAGTAIFGGMIWGLFINIIVPLLGVFYGTSLIADEVDDKTITYLFTRPIPRRAVLIGKYLAYLACTILLVLPSVMLMFFLVIPIGSSSIAEGFPLLLTDFAMLAIGLAAYGAVFALVGTRMKRPLIVGLVYAFGWEPAVVFFPGYLKRLTVAYYLQALVRHEMPQDSPASLLFQALREVPSLTTSLISLGVIITATLWLAGQAVERREYVLDQ